ncbi:MAG: NAD(P)H-dependent oxidoreductase subunit E [Candidatus Riflebacteria bacterium]|nr:NAD(P)H-dependent oxidoreductase subunit E [Candidatus Riflebacteria bacterium]
MSQVDYPVYETRILPALRRIQDKHGYLEPQELKRLSKAMGIPLHRLHEVGSFFPHFRLSKPPRVTLRVCRDMACHLAGSGQMLQELGKMAGEEIRVEGTSCLGRCDRAPAASVALARHEITAGHAHHSHVELYYLGRSSDELERIARQCLEGRHPASDLDADLPCHAADWTIDLYRGRPSTYSAVLKAVAARDASLARATDLLLTRFNWTRESVEQFRLSARRRAPSDKTLSETVLTAIRAWQTADGWAQTPELGNWSDALLQELDRGMDDATRGADLRGLGGAGRPASTKWRDVRDAIRTARLRRMDDRGFIIVNGDESEPATFKDRELLLRSPHLIIEGVILAGLVTEATQGFIYIRHEYPEQIGSCEEEIRRAESLGVCGLVAPALGRPFPLSVFVSPGGYICGEESALIEAMCDRRGEPRNMPPMLTTNGLDDQPTLVGNVETFGWAPYIWQHGGQSYADLGLHPWRGRRFFSICGDVVRPGAYEVPMGLPLRELVHGESYGRGIKGGKRLKAIAPSGPSGGFVPAVLTATSGLPPDHVTKALWLSLARRRGLDPAATELDILDLELELAVWRALSPSGALGAGLCVYAEGRDMADQAVNAMEFYRNESCGKCVPCRLGSRKMAALGDSLLKGQVDVARWRDELLPLVKDLDDTMAMTSICGLGRSVTVPLRSVIQYFAHDLSRYTAPASPSDGAPAPGRDEGR